MGGWLSLVWDLWLWLLMARLWMQYYCAPYHHPVSQWVIRPTSWALSPLQRYLPKIGGIDVAVVAVFGLAALLKYVSISYVMFGHAPAPLAALVLVVADFLKKVINFFSYLIILRAILSWFDPSPKAPMMQMLVLITEPLMRWGRHRFPWRVGMLDLSTLIVVLLLQLIYLVGVQPILHYGWSMINRL